MIEVEEMLAREREAFDDGLMDTFGVMTYELGAIAQNLMYAKNERGDERAKNALHANALLEVADLVTQCSLMYAKIMEASPTMKDRPTWSELVIRGRMRMMERMTKLIEREQRTPSLTGTKEA